jgi:hypothetical protein
LNFEEDAFHNQIAITIRNINGMYSNIFIPEKAFDKVVVTFIEKMKQPCQTYVSKVSKILQNNVIKHTEKMSRYPTLREELRKLIISHILEREVLCKERMVEMIDEEMSYINKMHEDFKMVESDEKHNKKEVDPDGIVYRGYLQLSTGRLAWAGKGLLKFGC